MTILAKVMGREVLIFLKMALKWAIFKFKINSRFKSVVSDLMFLSVGCLAAPLPKITK